MNKIKNLFKASPIAMIMVGLVIAGVASAALVNYLSNYTKATTTVSSPVTMSVNLGENGAPTGNALIDLGATYGGSDVTFTTVAQNHVNKPISGYNVMVLRETDGASMTGKEIAQVMYRDNKNSLDLTDITDTLYVVHSDGTLELLSSKIWDNKKLVIMSDYTKTGTSQLTPLAANDVFWNVYTATLNTATVGTYEVYSQYVTGTPADLAAYATAQYATP